MAFEVHTGSQSAHPRRALWTAILLLAGTMALAASMTSARRADPLGTRLEPVGWPVSFRVPRSFDLDDVMITAHGPAVRLVRVTGPMDPVGVMIVRFIPASHGASVAELLLSILRHDGLDSDPLSARADEAPPTSRQPVGQLDGLEARNQAGNTVTRTGIAGSGDGVAVSLHVNGVAINPELYRLFDLVCRSVEYGPTGS